MHNTEIILSGLREQGWTIQTICVIVMACVCVSRDNFIPKQHHRRKIKEKFIHLKRHLKKVMVQEELHYIGQLHPNDLWSSVVKAICNIQ